MTIDPESREIDSLSWNDQISVQYVFAVDREVYLYDVIDACRQLLKADEGTFPSYMFVFPRCDELCDM